MSKPLWRSALETLRDRFFDGAKSHHGLKCVLVHAGEEQRHREDDLPPGLAHKKKEELFDGANPMIHFGGGASYGIDPWERLRRQSKGPHEYRDWSETHEDKAWRNWYFVGSKASVEVFRLLATDAGKCTLQLETIPGVPPESMRASALSRSAGVAILDAWDVQAYHQWVYILFDLAWTGNHSPLTVARRYFDDSCLPIISEWNYRWGSHRGPGRPVGAPDWFYSQLPDMFMASVYAIDLLRAEKEPDLERVTRPKGTGESGTPTPPTDRAVYDPYTSMPQTLRDLETYAIAHENARKPTDRSSGPISLHSARGTALDWLLTLLRTDFGVRGTEWVEPVRKLRGEYGKRANLGWGETEDATLEDVARVLGWCKARENADGIGAAGKPLPADGGTSGTGQSSAPTPPAGNESEGAAESGKGTVRPCCQKAYQQYQYATQQNPNIKKDRDAYTWLQQHADTADDLPTYANWTRYLREARRHHSDSKHTPRKSKAPDGKSVVRRDQI